MSANLDTESMPAPFTFDMFCYLESKKLAWLCSSEVNTEMRKGYLVRLMEDNHLSKEAQYMVFYLFSAHKSRDMVIKAMDEALGEEKEQPWFEPVKRFIKDHTVQFVVDMEHFPIFAAESILTCQPRLDLMIYKVFTKPGDRCKEELAMRPTFGQLNLGEEMQNKAREGYDYYWHKMARKLDEVGMKLLGKEEMDNYYAMNMARDRFHLLDTNWTEFPPGTLPSGTQKRR